MTDNEPFPPADYHTPAYDARWIRQKLNLPVDCPISKVQGKMHVICSHAHGYETYIKAFRCDDKQGEIARLHVEVGLLHDLLESAWNEIDTHIGCHIAQRFREQHLAAIERRPTLVTPPPAAFGS